MTEIYEIFIEDDSKSQNKLKLDSSKGFEKKIISDNL